MIDNFDELVQRCSARRRRRMIRLSLFWTGGILLLVASAAAYLQWHPLATPEAETKAPPAARANAQTASPAATEAVMAEPSSAPASAEMALPDRNDSKPRAFVVQLTSAKSYDEVDALRQKIASRYQPSLAIYFINGYYTLRYIDVYDRASGQQVVRYFQAHGFPSPAVYTYSPKFFPVTRKNLPQQEKRAPAAEALPTPRAALSSDITAAKPSSDSRLFHVQSGSESSADPLDAYQNRPGYDTAIAVARDMYAKNRFSDAAVWAKKANQLNREAEEAWLLSAKAYYAQGRKKEAIGVLELYLNYKESRAATELLRTWKNSGE